MTRRRHDLPLRVLDRWARLLPTRIAKEDLGDYMEDVNRRVASGQRVRPWIRVFLGMLWTAVNAVGHTLTLKPQWFESLVSVGSMLTGGLLSTTAAIWLHALSSPLTTPSHGTKQLAVCAGDVLFLWVFWRPRRTMSPIGLAEWWTLTILALGTGIALRMFMLADAATPNWTAVFGAIGLNYDWGPMNLLVFGLLGLQAVRRISPDRLPPQRTRWNPYPSRPPLDLR